MADDKRYIRQGEVRPIEVEITAASGTLTVQAAPTCTLTDESGAIAGGISGAAAQFQAGAQAAPLLWYVLDTTGLPVGEYTLSFKAQALGSDGVTRTMEPSVRVEVQSRFD